MTLQNIKTEIEIPQEKEIITFPTKDEKNFLSSDYVQALHYLGYDFKMRATDNAILVNGESLSDDLEAEIRARLRDNGITHVKVARDAMIAYARSKTFHPVKDYFSSLVWDGQDRITMLCDYFSDEDSLFQVVIRRWLMGAVAKIYQPARVRMLVLDGPQNLGKSYFVRWLASPLKDHLVESGINPDQKDDLILLANAFIWEVAEVESTTSRKDVGALKNFVTRTTVTFRPPYGHNSITKPAMASFVGTINNVGGFLNDPSGHSRFMTVKITGINWDYTKIEIDQLWAQAKYLYESGDVWEPTADELTRINAKNDSYQIDNLLTDLLQRHFYIDATRHDWKTYTLDIAQRLKEVGNWRGGNTANGDGMLIASALAPFNLQKIAKPYKGYYGITQK